MKLRLTELEARETPAVTIDHGEIMPSPDGDPGGVVKFIQGDPNHVYRVVTPAGGPWLRIVVAA